MVLGVKRSNVLNLTCFKRNYNTIIIIKITEMVFLVTLYILKTDQELDFYFRLSLFVHNVKNKQFNSVKP